MRVTIAALGWELDLTLGPATKPEPDEPEGNSLDGGTTASMPVGFVAAHDVPDEATIHRPVSPWEDDSGA